LLGKEYKYRDKRWYDAKWHKVPFRVQQVITNNLWDINGETLVTVVKKDKFSLISWFEQFKIADKLGTIQRNGVR
jgi:hypothetical protein